MNARAHWERIYRGRRPEERSWTQKRPGKSLALIRAARPPKGAVVLDAGAGASTLADFLDKTDRLILVDISAAALRETKKRLGSARAAAFKRADLAKDALDLEVDVWHDRAVFHFLTRAADRRRYMSSLRRCVKPGGAVVMSAFAPTGPQRCSGLPVRRYTASALGRELGPGFKVVRRLTERHRRPFGGSQDFVYVLAIRTGLRRPTQDAGSRAARPGARRPRARLRGA